MAKRSQASVSLGVSKRHTEESGTGGHPWVWPALAGGARLSRDLYTALRLLPGGDGPAQGDTAVCEDVPIAVGIVVFFTSFIGPRAFDLKEKEHQ